MRFVIPRAGRSGKLVASAILAVSILLAWSPSLDAPLAFDDFGSIRDNPTIRPPYEMAKLLHPPGEGGQTVSGRPLLNISFALNHWISGEDYSVYRITNLFIHFLNALLVFAIARTSMRYIATDNERIHNYALPLAISILWSLHPLTTAAVSYLIQRAESLAALFILLTLYCFARSIRSSRTSTWLAASCVACWLGTLCKETVAAAPFLVALYAWTIAPKGSLQVRRNAYRTYLALLFASLIPIVALTLSTGDRAGTASLSVGVDSIDYIKTQSWAITRYLQLAIWPANLVFDYGRDLDLGARSDWAIRGMLLLALLAASVYFTSKRSPVGFLGLGAFLLLAPSSSIFPLADPVFEHRFYLPLALVISGITACLIRLPKRASIPIIAVASIALSLATYGRNQLYRDDLALWKNALAFSERNARAHTNIGALYLERGRISEAEHHLRQSIEIEPTPLRHHNLANALAMGGRVSEAIPYYLKTLEAEPSFIPSLLGLAQSYATSGDNAKAIERYREALKLNPEHYDGLRGLAQSLLAENRLEAAVETYRTICSLRPASPSAFFDLGDALARLRRFEESRVAFTEVTKLDPDNAQAFANIGNLHLMEKRYPEAIASYERSLAIVPTAMTHTNLAICLIYSRRIPEAKLQLDKALTVDPNYAPAQDLRNRLN